MIGAMLCGLPFLAPFGLVVAVMFGWGCWKEAGR